MNLFAHVASTKPARLLSLAVLLTILLGVPACSQSLESHHGPATGLVSGVVCDDLTTLTAVNELPAIGSSLIQEGKCLHLRNPEQVNFIRTVVMPGDGEYSQFELATKSTQLKLWIRTELVRKVSG